MFDFLVGLLGKPPSDPYIDTSRVEKYYADHMRMQQASTQLRIREIFEIAERNRKKLEAKRQKEIKERIAIARANKSRKIK